MICLPGMPCYQNPTYSSDCGCGGGYPASYYPKNCSDPCLSSNYVCYNGPNLPNSGIVNGDTLTILLQKIDGALGTVTSVGLSMPSGFSVTGSPITSSGTLGVTTSLNGIIKGNGSGFLAATSGVDYAPATVGSSILYGNGSGGFSNAIIGTGLSFAGGTLSNSSPDQVVSLLEGTNITITGTYPTFTINSSGGISGLTSPRIPFASGPSSLVDSPDLTWDNTNSSLKVGPFRIFSKGASSIFQGVNAGNFVTLGTSNIGIGENSLNNVASGSHNVAIGTYSLRYLSTGFSNISIGTDISNSVTTGSGNIMIGTRITPIVNSITSGNYNVIIGYDILSQDHTADGQLSIQNIIFGVNNTAIGTNVSTGNIGIATPSPTARLHLPSGSSSVGSAPLKFSSGVNLSTPENGTLEFNGSYLYFTVGGVRQIFQLIKDVTIVAGTNYNISVNDNIIHADNTLARTFSLPPGANAINGKIIWIKDSGGNAGTNAITVNADGLDTFEDGSSSINIVGDFTVQGVYWGGSRWNII